MISPQAPGEHTPRLGNIPGEISGRAPLPLSATRPRTRSRTSRLYGRTHHRAPRIRHRLPGLQGLIEQTTDRVQNHDVRTSLARYLEDYGANLTFEQVVQQASPDIQAIFRSDVLPGGPNFVSEQDYAAARDIHLPALRLLYRDYFARTGVAAIVFPATMAPPPPIGEDVTVDIDGRKVPFFTVVGRNIAPGSTASLPGLVLPAGLTAAGLPVGIEFDGPAGSDRGLLALGLGLERELGPLPAPAHFRLSQVPRANGSTQ